MTIPHFSLRAVPSMPCVAVRALQPATIRRVVSCLTMLVVGLAIPASALAHAGIHPMVSAPGTYERYVLRVPNERDVATTRIEIRFPAGLRVVSFGDVPGWRLEVLSDSAMQFVGAVWTGELPPERFVEFPFVAVNPRESVRLVWPTVQTYAGGERVDWSGPEDSERPAPVTRVASSGIPDAGPSWAGWVSLAALVLAIASLVVALRSAPRPA